MKPHVFLIPAILLWGIVGCDDKSNADDPGPSATTQMPSPEAVKPVEEKPARRTELEPYRGLLEEASRAEVDAGGLFIDFGDSATIKWTGGRWHNGWGDNQEGDDIAWTSISGSKVRIPVTQLESDEPVAEVALRMRSKCGQSMSVRIDGEEAHKVDKLAADWSTIRFEPAEKLGAGQHEVELYVRGGKCNAEIDWAWFADAAGGEPMQFGARQEPVAIGGAPRRALVAPGAITYRWYLDVPEESELVFDYASEGDSKFAVKLTRDGEPTKTLFEEAGKAEWTEGVVDLKEYAGSTVRLELARTGADGTAGWADPEIMRPKTDKKMPGGDKPKNVILIVIDTIRADVFEPLGGEGSKVQTPSFDALLPESTVFTRAYVNENWTKPSVATILSGLYPVTHNAKLDDDTVSPDIELVTETLKSHGFATGGFIANGYVSNKYGFDQGWDFNRNYIRENFKSDADKVYADALEWVNEQGDKPFFLYVQTIDPHVPYRVDRKYTEPYFAEEPPKSIGKMLGGRGQQDLNKRELTEKELAWVEALYYGEVTFHDEFMGKFIEDIRKKGILDDTVLIITNDHGEELGEHGRLGHGHTLYDELVRAPLLIRHPGRFRQGEVVHDPVEAVDITPTILDLLELPANKDHDGFSIMPLLEGQPLSRPAYAVSDFLDKRRSIRVGDWKMHRWPQKANLYNVKDDPLEEKDLADTAHIARRMVEVHLAEALATPDKRARVLGTKTTKKKFDPGVVEMDAELRKQLDALGYFGDE